MGIAKDTIYQVYWRKNHIEILPCAAVDVAVTVDGIAVDEVDVVATVVFVAVVGSEIVDTEVT